MKIEAAIKLLSRLPIRDRDSGKAIPFVLNPNQRIAADKMIEREKQGKPVWVISLKARRVGVSSFVDGLGLCHVLSQPLAIGKIVAHLDKSVEALFRIPKSLAQGMQQELSSGLFRPITQEKITAIHQGGDSELSISTAGSTQGGRGDGVSFLHLSEAAYYAGEGSFTSLLNAVPYHPSTMIAIESTANGKVGIGESFYRYWKDAEAGRNEFLPIFLSWLDDPACVRNPDEAKDAPVDQNERDLIKHFGASKAQLAWRRWCIYNKCSGYVETFFQEYPAFSEEAFTATGNPAFIKEELSAARGSVTQGSSIEWTRTEDKKIDFRPGGNGSLIFFEQPQADCKYYIGCDAARGQEDGDFAAATVINGSTMEVAARFADRVTPAVFAQFLNTLGRYYNNAMMCIELTGGWGDWVQTLLRDTFNYPFFYMWKGFDDKARSPKAARNQMGWKTTPASRERLFTAFREALREQELCVKDEQIVVQMEQAERISGHWEVKKGHDDILFSALLANMAIQHYPPSRKFGKPKNTAAEDIEEELKTAVNWKPGHEVPPDGKGIFLHEMISKHVKDLELGSKLKGRVQPLQGI